MKLIDPATGQAVWDSNDPNAGPVPPAPEGRQWVRVDEPGDTMAPRRTAPGILDIGNGVTERLAFLNQTFNPVEGIGSAMRAGSRMVAPDQSYWDRIASLGEMVSGVASIAAPIAAAKAIGVPAASAMMEGLLGASPTSQAATDMARGFTADESGAFRLYHGTPHNFPPVRLIEMPDGTRLYQNMNELTDTPAGARIIQEYPMGRFDMSKIGTGEGAQAYGHGLYFAEAEDIAKSYRDQLANGWRLEVRDPIREAGITGRDLDSASQMLSTSYSGKAAADDWENWTGKTLTPEQRSAFEEAFAKKGGSLYEVEINANPEDFLDWDLPLSEQPQAVQKAVEANMPEYKTRNIAGVPHVFANNRMIEINDPNLTGRDAYILSRMGQPGDLTKEQAAAASSALREAGIPGIRYLDAGSRGAGDGTRNYVVFDENLINIVRKYGIAGAATMLGVSALDVEQALAENMSPSQWDQLVVGPQ